MAFRYSQYLFRVNKDCAQIMSEINDVRAATDEVGRSKVGRSHNIEMSFEIFPLPGLC